MMVRTQWRRLGAVLTAGTLLAACDKVDDLTKAAEEGLIVNGVVKDSYGKPVTGAEVLVYTYSQNLNAFGRPDEVDQSQLTDPAAYKAKVDLGELIANGDPEVAKGTTDDKGAFEIKGLAIDGVILLARKANYAVDIAGMDETDGTISINSALVPTGADKDNLTFTITQNFVLAGGPAPFSDDGHTAIPDDVVPVIPPAPPEPPAPPTVEPPAAPDCLNNAECAPGEVCKAGVCGPECTEATVETDCGPAKGCREGACGPQCLGHSECADGEICDAETMGCVAEECQDDAACGGLRQCNGEENNHGYCAPTCTDGGGECGDTQICDLNLGGCRFECLANADCAGDTPLCSGNHCVAAECGSHEECVAAGHNGGYCNEFACQRECEADDACADRNMVCDAPAGRCKIECGADEQCAGHAVGPLCNNYRCAVAECGEDADCLAADKNGGFCVSNRCAIQCAPDGDIAGTCGDANAECPRARCIMPDPNELHPPTAVSPWTKFLVTDADGTTITDASAGTGIIGADVDLAKLGGVVRLVAEVTDGGDAVAYLRVQFGDSHCEPVGFAPRSVDFPVSIVGGKLVSEKGDFQEWVVAAGYQQFQLDLDHDSANGNESNLVHIADRCSPEPGPNVTPKSSLIVTLGWDKERVDADLHIWNEAGEETFYGSRVGGERRRSNYGRIDVDDRNGFGPEVFTLNDDVTTGSFTVRARYFAGPVATTTSGFQVRVIRKLGDGTYADEVFQAEASRRAGDVSGWVDIGVFAIGEGSTPIETTPVE